MGGCFFGRKEGERTIRKTSIDGAEYSWRSLHKKIITWEGFLKMGRGVF